MLEKLSQLNKSHGPLKRLRGLSSTTTALCLGIFCFFGVLGSDVPHGFAKHFNFLST